MFLTAYLLGINALSFIMYAEDKGAAMGWLPFLGRVPEVFLHQVELAGGSAGAFVAQRMLRHKISKLSYQRGFSQVLLAQVAGGLAWGYFQGPSWTLAGAGLAPAVMLAVTARHMHGLKDWKNRRDHTGRPQWQRPVDAAAPPPSRRRARSGAPPEQARRNGYEY